MAPFFATHLTGIAVTVKKVAEKNFSPFAYNETADHVRGCMNCEALLTLGERPPYNCFPHSAQTDDRNART